MTVLLQAAKPPPPAPPDARRSPAWPLVLVPLLVVPLGCLALLVWLPEMGGVRLASAVFLLVAVLVLLVRPRGLLSARTWVVGYLVLQFPVRALFLLTAPKERPPIYAEVSPGVGLEPALVTALLESILGLAVLGAVYVLGHQYWRPPTRPSMHVALRWQRAYLLLLVGAFMLPIELTAGSGSSGAFIISLPGLAASGAAAVVCFAFVQSPGRWWPIFLLAVAYTAARVTLLSSKMALLAGLLAAVLSLVGRLQRRRGRLPVVRGTIVVLVCLATASYIFAVGSGRSHGRGVADSVGQGAQAAVSRSYGVDAVVATNEHLARGARPLYGQSFVEIVYSWVPRAFWPDKPRSFSIRYGEDVFSFTQGVGREFFAPSYSGEWLLNFGVPGLVLGWMLFGLALARVDALASIPHRMLWLASLVHLVEGSVVAQFWLAAPFIVGGYWVLRRDAVVPDALRLAPVPLEATA